MLYPVHSVDAQYRYLDLRKKGISFLQKHGLVESFEFHKTGMAGFQGCFVLTVRDPSLFPKLLTHLQAEDDHRNPKQKAEAGVINAHSSIVASRRVLPSSRIKTS